MKSFFLRLLLMGLWYYSFVAIISYLLDHPLFLFHDPRLWCLFLFAFYLQEMHDNTK